MLRWSWPSDVRSHTEDLAHMLAASVADDGILGYASPPSRDQVDGFVTGLEWLVSRGDGHVLVGQDDAGVVAMCVMKANGMPNCRHIAEVAKAYLSPRMRGSSAVYQLVDQVCAKASTLGVELLTIDVREGSKAHRVWS